MKNGSDWRNWKTDVGLIRMKERGKEEAAAAATVAASSGDELAEEGADCGGEDDGAAESAAAARRAGPGSSRSGKRVHVTAAGGAGSDGAESPAHSRSSGRVSKKPRR